MTKVQFSEEQQRDLFAQQHNERTESLYFEVPVFSRSVDMVINNTSDCTITAVEFKIGDWKRALEQALCVAMCFDYLEICVVKPKRRSTSEFLISSCFEVGVGVYFFDPEQVTFEHSLYPQKLSKIWQVQRENVLKYIDGRSI